MSKFFTILAFLTIIILVLPIPQLRLFFDTHLEAKTIVVIIGFISVLLSGYFGVIAVPVKKIRTKLLKVHHFGGRAITILLPNKKKEKLYGEIHVLIDSLKKGDIVDIEYKGWSLEKIKKVDLKTENKPEKPAKSTKARK